ncbi:gag protein [Tanacetum coccineum]
MLAIPHHSQVLSMAEIDSKEAQKKLKAGICFRITSHNKHTWFLLSQKKHKLQVQEMKTSAINRAFFRANFLQQRRFQKTQAEILGIQQRPDESLKEYVARFSKETLHMADRSDIMVSEAFISGLRPGRLFKDLIAKPPTSLEDLFTQTLQHYTSRRRKTMRIVLREPRRKIKQQ